MAGDIAAGDAFLKELQPYVWRKYMDYAAIADVHSIKRQIHAHKGHGEIAVKGHNVKLGRGGIREIEFFVQTQQLIAGGRFPRTARPRDRADARRTGEARLDHRRGARRADQAILVPAPRRARHPDGRRRADAYAAGRPTKGWSGSRTCSALPDAEDFSAAFRASLHEVERHYAALFETAPELSSGIGNLVFTGDVDDPDTLKTLRQLGFKRPSDICRVIRSWHFGRYRATQSAEARERLTELTPALLRGLRPDDAAPTRRWCASTQFLAGLPAGIQLFSLLQSNPAC